MPTQFSFEGALTHVFRAAHARSFPWVFSAAYALVFTGFFLLFAFMAKDAVIGFFQSVEALEHSNIDETDPAAMMAALFGTMTPFVPYAVLASVGSWVLWAMFEAASQRRYVRDEAFSLRLGGDEVRMMVVGLLWTVMYLAFFGLPIVMAYNGAVSLFNQSIADRSEEVLARQAVSTVFSVFGLFLLLFPVYVFFATRLAPCFAMTVKDRKIVFFDAWNVSRGRFWPILGAFLILSIAGGIISGIISQILQFVLMASAVPDLESAESGEDLVRLATSLSFLVPMGMYFAARMFLSGLLQHVTGGPAAFAARHDPRGGVDDAARMAVFE